ncbi:EGF-like domain-containing protein [Bandra megavirus]|uniref:EGF-like domain-containing protein n=1 Tax=Bandra megavirus TaxID=2071566 RepID=A0A2K9V954_9VIRU|nr:EGF-like domain-containing protein [Bandra megavirus]
MAKSSIVIVAIMLLLGMFSASNAMDGHTVEYPELINAEAFFPNGSFAMISLNSTILENNYKYNYCPGVDMDALRELRLEVLEKWVSRTNQDFDHILDIYRTYGTTDTLANGTISPYIHLFIADGIGTYSGREVAAEYALLAVDPSGVHLFSQLDASSVQWNNDNISAIYNIITNYTFYNGAFSLDGFINTQYIRYEPCTANVWIDYSRQDPLVSRFLAASTGAQASPQEICTVIMDSCTGSNQVYDTFQDCVNYMSGVAANSEPCPGKYIGNTTTCHKFHANSAIYLPEVHCPHVRPYTSTVCRDFCVTRGCGNCDPNAECVFNTPFGKLVPTYECRCRDGYVGDGKTCTRIPCQGDWNCPSDYSYTKCNGTCGCRTSGGFLWNSTQDAINQNKACGCGENEFINWFNGSPECVPIGRCREVWQCPQAATQYNSITCSQYGTNVLIPYKTCLCNYGYANLGFARNCECPAPGREVWSTTKQGTLCLTPSECTDNYHCSSGSCAIPPGQWLGVCVPAA